MPAHHDDLTIALSDIKLMRTLPSPIVDKPDLLERLDELLGCDRWETATHSRRPLRWSWQEMIVPEEANVSFDGLR